jgi:hypothetical protein
MADDGLSRLRQYLDSTLAEIKSLEVTLAHMPAGSPVAELTRRVIATLKAQVAEVENFLSKHPTPGPGN